jgi:hypothetical protein
MDLYGKLHAMALRKESLVSHEQKTGWAPEQDWALRREKTPLPWQGIEPRFLSSLVCILVTTLITFTEFRIL